MADPKTMTFSDFQKSRGLRITTKPIFSSNFPKGLSKLISDDNQNLLKQHSTRE